LLPKDKIIIVNLSGRGDKDVQQVAALLGAKTTNPKVPNAKES
jgi:tryptophan synthase beta subunit